jgi:DNA-binding SARP family transcriptional activator
VVAKSKPCCAAWDSNPDGASCAALVNLLWPASDSTQATQSLNSLVYSLHKLIGDALSGAPPVLHEDGYYRLNMEAGVGVDVACFDAGPIVSPRSLSGSPWAIMSR